MNMFARFVENPAMTLQVIKKTKRYVIGNFFFFFQPDSLMHMFNVSILYRKSIKLLP